MAGLSKELKAVRNAVLRMEKDRYPSAYSYMGLASSIRVAIEKHNYDVVEQTVKDTVRDWWKHRLEIQ